MASGPPRRSQGWRALRNRVIASPAFQSWSARFPLTRPIARRQARSLFDLTAGFVYSQVLHACVRVGLPARLAEGPLSPEAAAAAFDLSPAAAERLLKAAAALGLAERLAGGRYGLGQRGAALLGAAGVAEMVEHHALLYADLADPLVLLRRGGGGGRLAGYWPYAADAPAEAEAYSRLMAASQAMVAAQLLGAYPIARHRRLLDVGGGEGAFLRAVAARAPRLELSLFDLPPVIGRARVALTEAGVQAELHGGSFFDDPLPTGADIVTLVRVLHDHDDPAALALLKAVHRALPPGGTLLVAEPMAGTRGAEPMGDAYFGLYLLAMGSGRPRSAAEIRVMLAEAGFRSVRRRGTALPLVAQLIVARV